MLLYGYIFINVYCFPVLGMAMGHALYHSRAKMNSNFFYCLTNDIASADREMHY